MHRTLPRIMRSSLVDLGSYLLHQYGCTAVFEYSCTRCSGGGINRELQVKLVDNNIMYVLLAHSRGLRVHSVHSLYRQARRGRYSRFDIAPRGHIDIVYWHKSRFCSHRIIQTTRWYIKTGSPAQSQQSPPSHQASPLPGINTPSPVVTLVILLRRNHIILRNTSVTNRCAFKHLTIFKSSMVHIAVQRQTATYSLTYRWQ
jgi:hypothetical protein